MSVPCVEGYGVRRGRLDSICEWYRYPVLPEHGDPLEAAQVPASDPSQSEPSGSATGRCTAPGSMSPGRWRFRIGSTPLEETTRAMFLTRIDRELGGRSDGAGARTGVSFTGGQGIVAVTPREQRGRSGTRVAITPMSSA